MFQIKLFFLICFISVLKSTEISPFNYPLFKQCNQSWGSNIMGSDNDTICQVGCLLTSVSMALNGHNISINGLIKILFNIQRNIADPASLNIFLQKNNGYIAGSDLVEGIIPNISPQHVQWIGFADQISREQIISALKQNNIIVIAHVLSPEATTIPDHFVLIVGYDDNDYSFYYVNDPGFQKSTYSLERIKNWRIFYMK